MALPQNNLVDSIQQNIQKMQDTATTPQGMAGTGATPQQVTMAGTPAQTQSVLQKKREESERMQQEREQRREQQQEQRQEEPTKQKVRAEKLGQVIDKFQGQGHLMSMVAGQISKRLEQVDKSQLRAKEFEEADQVLKSIAEKVMRGETLSYQDVEELNKRRMTVQDLFEDGEQVQFGDISPASTTIESLGPEAFTDVGVSQDELAGLLGLSPEALAGMTINQLQAKLQDVQNVELNRVEQLQAQAEGLPKGSVARKQLESEIQDIVGTGEAALSEELQQEAQKFESADVLTVNGKELQLDELFQDQELVKQVPYLLSLDPADVQDNPVLQKLVAHAHQFRDEYEARLSEAQQRFNTVETAKTATEALQKSLPEGVWEALGGKDFTSVEDLEKWRSDPATQAKLSLVQDPTIQKDTEIMDLVISGKEVTIPGEGSIKLDSFDNVEKYKAERERQQEIADLVDEDFGEYLVKNADTGYDDFGKLQTDVKNVLEFFGFGDPRFSHADDDKKYSEMDPEYKKLHDDIMDIIDPDGNKRFDASSEMKQALVHKTFPNLREKLDKIEEKAKKLSDKIKEENKPEENKPKEQLPPLFTPRLKRVKVPSYQLPERKKVFVPTLQLPEFRRLKDASS